MVRLAFAVLALGSVIATPAFAATDAAAPPAQNWSFNGAFGTYDRAALQRGFQVYKEVCAACHSMNYVAYRNLGDPGGPGFTEAEVKAIAASVEVAGPPDDAGEPTTRAGAPSDRFKAPYANDKAARAANNGALPPDLSLIAKAREHGPDYVYGILVGYTDPPADVTLGQGMHYNKYFPGHQIAMPPPLSADVVTYGDGTKATVDQMSHDVSAFLMWAAEPKLEERKRIGFQAMVFLVVATGVFYAVKRKVWSDVH